MLTVDLVRARQRGGELKLTELKGRARGRALQLAEAYLEVARGHVGLTRGAFDEACQDVPHGPRERKLALGLRKLVEDECLFEADERVDARELRRQVFLAASARRRELALGEVFDREAVLEEVAAARGRGETPEDLLRGLYSDLREAHILMEAPPGDAAALVARYELAQAQAVLLRATRVSAEVRASNPATYRYLFGKIKFRRLLYALHPAKGGGYRLELSGPYSLFSSVTKYGLQLALVLPAIQQCDRWSIHADLLWGKERRSLSFRLSGGTSKAERARYGLPEAPAVGAPSFDDLPEEVAELAKKIEKLDAGWSVEPASRILDLPGLGLCVPDLRFVHDATGTDVFLEVMGFWSRDAVWKRVELVQAGLGERILFAVPKRLRVSEEVLDDDLPGRLYVYKGKMNAKQVVQRLDALLAV